MSGPFIDDVAERAMAALRKNEPEEALGTLQRALERQPDRMDLLNALAVTQVQLGQSPEALQTIARAEAVAYEKRDETAAMLMPQITLTKAAAAEDALRPAVAEAAYRELLTHEEYNPRARSGLGYLLLSWGRTAEGLAELETYLEHAADEPQYLEVTAELVAAVRKVRDDDVHPKEFIAAHQGMYVSEFDEVANKLTADGGWIAEAARMHRDDDGDVVNTIPEGARPYAAVRVDLVNMATYQPGMVGDQPLVVALAGHEVLARTPVLLSWPARDLDYPAWISTQCPWNHLPLAIRFEETDIDAVAVFDEPVGAWYTAGFDGAFGDSERGRLHEITDIQSPEPGVALVQVDCGRASTEAIPDLLRRLDKLHDRHRIQSVLIGRGFVPTGADPDNEAEPDYD